VIPPCGQAWTHQSQPLHCFSLMMSMPVSSDWLRAFSGQAFTHWASSQNLHVRAKLNRGVIRMTRILDARGFPWFSFFSSAQVYSQIPQPVHLLGLTVMNFLWMNLVGGIVVSNVFWVSKYFCARLSFCCCFLGFCGLLCFAVSIATLI
jgi:hypothetical protein